MAKGNVGLPSDFTIKIPKPVEIGDYLDETSDRPAEIQPKPRSVTPIVPVELENDSYLDQKSKYEQVNRNREVAPIVAKVEKKVVQPIKKAKSFKRKQINMTPQTLERFEEIVTYVQEYSQQSDAAASEVMDAIISAHHDAMNKLRLGSVPLRGRWGTPTAQAFKDALSSALVSALVEHHAGNSSKKISNG